MKCRHAAICSCRGGQGRLPAPPPPRPFPSCCPLPPPSALHRHSRSHGPAPTQSESARRPRWMAAGAVLFQSAEHDREAQDRHQVRRRSPWRPPCPVAILQDEHSGQMHNVSTVDWQDSPPSLISGCATCSERGVVVFSLRQRALQCHGMGCNDINLCAVTLAMRSGVLPGSAGCGTASAVKQGNLNRGLEAQAKTRILKDRGRGKARTNVTRPRCSMVTAMRASSCAARSCHSSVLGRSCNYPRSWLAR